MNFPGGALKFASYNSSADAKISNFAKGYVLPLTYFGNVFNISAIEFTPVGTGSIIIELVSPECSDGQKWCTLTKKCERNCVTKFESITQKFNGFENRLDDFTCDAIPNKGMFINHVNS